MPKIKTSKLEKTRAVNRIRDELGPVAKVDFPWTEAKDRWFEKQPLNEVIWSKVVGHINLIVSSMNIEVYAHERHGSEMAQVDAALRAITMPDFSVSDRLNGRTHKTWIRLAWEFNQSSRNLSQAAKTDAIICQAYLILEVLKQIKDFKVASRSPKRVRQLVAEATL